MGAGSVSLFGFVRVGLIAADPERAAAVEWMARALAASHALGIADVRTSICEMIPLGELALLDTHEGQAVVFHDADEMLSRPAPPPIITPQGQ